MTEPASASPRAGIVAVATVVGEHELDAGELGRRLGASAETIARSLGDKRVWVAPCSEVEFAVQAGRRALERAELKASDVDLIVWIGSPSEHGFYAQHLLGAKRAAVVLLGGWCERAVFAMKIAGDAIAAGRARTVLIVGARAGGHITLAPIHETTTETIFSDGAGAMVIGADRGHRLLGFGNALDGEHAFFLREVVEGRNQLSYAQMLYETRHVNRRALAECFADAGLRADRIDHIVFAFEPGGIPRSFARALRLPVEKILEVPGGPAHTEAFDPIFGLERVLTVGRPDEVVLVGARTIGAMSFAALRL